MLAWPAYTTQDEDYQSLLMKSLKNAQRALKYYQITKNNFKVTEINLFISWILALHGKVKRAEIFLKKGTKEFKAPVPTNNEESCLPTFCQNYLLVQTLFIMF